MLFPVIMMVGCSSEMSMNEVLGAIQKKSESLSGYKISGTMTIHTGKTPVQYDVQVWHKRPHYYRVTMENANQSVSQMILRNDDGVFVLTPSLNKSFRFQSDWPKNHEQPYLLESIVNALIQDEGRMMESTEEGYVFKVKGNYRNQSMVAQQIAFSKEMMPLQAEIFDAEGNQLVVLKFNDVQLNPTFPEDAFSKEKNMQQQSMNSTGHIQNAQPMMGVIHPSYLPDGVELLGVEQVERAEGDVFVLKYGGTYQFVVTEERPQALQASTFYGTPVDLGSTIGVMTGTAQKSLHWTDNGVDYLLSGTLPEQEMLLVAQSLLGQISSK